MKQYKVKKAQVGLIEIPVKEILKDAQFKTKDITLMPKEGFEYRKLSKFPVVNRDLAFIVDKELEANKVKDSIKNQSDLITRVELFDEFASDYQVS